MFRIVTMIATQTWLRRTLAVVSASRTLYDIVRFVFDCIVALAT